MTDKEIMILWRDYAHTSQDRELILEFANKIRTAERERCANICRSLMRPAASCDAFDAGRNIALGNAARKIEKAK